MGQCFQALAAHYPQWTFVFADSDTLDITQSKAVNRFFEEENSRTLLACINCAAYTAVDKAESEPQLARSINTSGAKNIAVACAKARVPLVHLSTDYVYHNRQNTPFKEGDPENPKGVYAATKLAGDRAVLKSHPTAGMVIRTSWVYSPHGNNFLKTMLRLGQERASLSVVFDQIGTPTYAPDLAAAVLNIVQQLDNQAIQPEQLAGIWHYSNEGVTSWYDFAVAIMTLAGLPCKIQPIETSQYPTPAQRPPFSVLNKAKIKAAFGLDIPHWRTGVLRCLEALGY